VTFIGKILIVMTLVMSILFSALSVVVFATHRNWRDETTTLQGQVAALEASNRRLREEMEQSQVRLAQEQAARKYEVATLTVQVAQATDQLRQSEALLATEQSNHGTLQQANSTAVNELARLTGEVGTLRTEVRDNRLARDERHQEVVRLTDELNTLEGIRSNQEVRNMQLTEDNARFRRVMDAFDLDPDSSTLARIPPRVDGLVVAVGENNLVEISIGKDDGLKDNHLLDVYRGGTYLGRLVVRRTFPDSAVTQIIPEFRRGLIRKGDRVESRLGMPALQGLDTITFEQE
jgi:cell division protein FtsL